MAFARKHLSRIGGSGYGATVWMYTSAESYSTVSGANYLAGAVLEMEKGDCVWVVDTATPTVHITYVDAVDRSAETISIATGDQVTA